MTKPGFDFDQFKFIRKYKFPFKLLDNNYEDNDDDGIAAAVCLKEGSFIENICIN